MQKDLEYLNLLRMYILMAIGIFFLSMISGYFISLMNPGLSEKMIEGFRQTFAGIINLNDPYSAVLLIFLNNTLKSLAIVVLGAGLGIILKNIFEFIGIWNYILANNPLKYMLTFVLWLFTIIPMLFTAYNGGILGIVVDSVSRQKGIFFVTAALLPHGIIEIPMILISTGMGLRLGMAMMNVYLKGTQIDMRSELTEAISFFVRRIAPLLLVAAIIETFITPLIALQFLKV